MEILVPISLGELIDKYVILHIKSIKISDPNKLKNIRNEIEYLQHLVNSKKIDSFLWDQLYEVNAKLWDVEDKLRIKEKNKTFDDEFIQLARSVYFLNDKRSQIKREINIKTASNIIEEKSYEQY